MGVIKRGVLGGFSGKVANVIGGSWKGIAYMRSLPLSVANPNTAGQVAQRSAFSDTVLMAQQLLTAIIKPLMDRFASGMSGFNYFVQQNIAEWVSAGVFTWANIRTSIGSLTPIVGQTIMGSAGTNNVGLSWTDNTGIGTAITTDSLYVAVYNATQNYWKFNTNLYARGDAAGAFADDVMLQNDVLHAYFSFISLDGTRVSTSGYATAVVGA